MCRSTVLGNPTGSLLAAGEDSIMTCSLNEYESRHMPVIGRQADKAHATMTNKCKVLDT